MLPAIGKDGAEHNCKSQEHMFPVTESAAKPSVRVSLSPQTRVPSAPTSCIPSLVHSWRADAALANHGRGPYSCSPPPLHTDLVSSPSCVLATAGSSASGEVNAHVVNAEPASPTRQDLFERTIIPPMSCIDSDAPVCRGLGCLRSPEIVYATLYVCCVQLLAFGSVTLLTLMLISGRQRSHK